MSAVDRVTTIRAAISPTAQADDIVSPGHVFPLRAQPGGVLTRRGHTEGSVDLATLAGLRPAGVLCELMNADGTMMRGAALERYAAQHGLVALTIALIGAENIAVATGKSTPIALAVGACAALMIALQLLGFGGLPSLLVLARACSPPTI